METHYFEEAKEDSIKQTLSEAGFNNINYRDIPILSSELEIEVRKMKDPYFEVMLKYENDSLILKGEETKAYNTLHLTYSAPNNSIYFAKIDKIEMGRQGRIYHINSMSTSGQKNRVVYVLTNDEEQAKVIVNMYSITNDKLFLTTNAHFINFITSELISGRITDEMAMIMMTNLYRLYIDKLEEETESMNLVTVDKHDSLMLAKKMKSRYE